MSGELYVALDDSNHAGKTGGEVIAAVFSHNLDMAQLARFPKKKSRSYMKHYLRGHHANFRFTTLMHDICATKPYNLPWVAPFLVRNYLDSLEDKAFHIDEMYIFLDGLVQPAWVDIMMEDFNDFDFDMSIRNFYGKKNKKYPQALILAHMRATSLFRTVFDKLVNMKEYVPVPLEQLLEREKMFAGHAV